MKTDLIYQLLLCFFAGFAQCVCLGYGIRLFRAHKKYQFQRVLAFVYFFAAVGFSSYFIMLAFIDRPDANYINTLLIMYDFLTVGGYMFFIVTLIFPNRYRTSSLLWFQSPYLLAIVVYAFTKSPVIYLLEVIYTFALSTLLLVWMLRSIKKYDRLLLDNVGNIEFFDLRWGAILVIFVYVVQIIYEFECIMQPVWDASTLSNRLLILDIVWCFITVFYVSFIYSKVTKQQVFIVQAQDNNVSDDSEHQSQSTDKHYKVLTNTDVDLCIKEKKYYLDSTLTLQKLATQLGTNRQYLSNYINREKQKTFYEYINDFRLEEAKNLLDGYDERNPQSMESIASLAGFNSYSTFLRSFVKKYDISPSKYLKSKQ